MTLPSVFETVSLSTKVVIPYFYNNSFSWVWMLPDSSIVTSFPPFISCSFSGEITGYGFCSSLKA
jgi:hypothetical protein